MSGIANWTLVTASNSEAVLRANLLASQVVDSRCQVIIQRNFVSAALAYNAGIRAAKHDIIVFAHQDVYLPKDWLHHLCRALDQLKATDPFWGVLGVFGVTASCKPSDMGHCYSAGLKRVLGRAFDEPVEALSLDEVVLVMRRSSGLLFDDSLPGFHLYGTDICMEARQRRMRNYIISAFCVHNTNGVRHLPAAFWRSYFYVRQKWSAMLPLRTCCVTISRSYTPILKQIAWDLRKTVFLSDSRGVRCPDVVKLYEDLVSRREAAIGST